MEVMDRINGPRITHSWVDLLDRDDNRIGRLDGVTGWQVQQRLAADVRGGMTLSLDDNGGAIDWLNVRFQPWKAVNDVSWPLGVYVPRTPVDQWSAAGRSFDVTCLDKTSLLRDPLPGAFVVRSGTPITVMVGELLRGSGEEKVTVTPSPALQRGEYVAPPGTKRIEVVNKLLESINYSAVYVDRYGVLRAEPYRRPQDRPVAAEFVAGAGTVATPSWSREQALSEIPNRVVLVANGDSDSPALVGVATNTNPASPFSIPSRGGRVVPREDDPENVEAATQSEINALAARRLADAQNPVANLDVSHAPVPLSLNDVVRFVPSGSHERLAVVQEWSDSSAPTNYMTGSWREVLDA